MYKKPLNRIPSYAARKPMDQQETLDAITTTLVGELEEFLTTPPPIATKQPQAPRKQMPELKKCTDGSDSESEASDRGEPVASPVAAKIPRQSLEKTKGKKRRKEKESSSSSSSSSDSDSSRSSAVSAARSHQKHSRREKRPRKEKKRSDRKSHDRERMPPPPSPTPRRCRSPPPSTTARVPETMCTPEQLNRSVYEEVIAAKSSARKTSGTASVRSVGSKRGRALGVEDLLKHVPPALRENQLAAVTVDVMMKVFASIGMSTSVKNQLMEAVQSIRSVDIGAPQTKEVNYPRIGRGDYLFASVMEKSFGYAYKDSLKLPDNEVSLMKAIVPKPLDAKNCGPNSLDVVFRNALKEMAACEYNKFDHSVAMSMKNPVLICGRHLELRLLEKIRTHYDRVLHEDIIEFMANPFPEGNVSKLEEHVHGQACTKYVRKLIDRYLLRASNFDSVVNETLGTPANMRVWTNKPTQTSTSNMLMGYLRSVREEGQDLFTFVCEYQKRMQPFLEAHDTFLAEVLKASELMSWMCFGITLNSPDGVAIMAGNYFVVETSVKDLDSANPLICWNYPLAMKYRQVQTAVQKPKLLDMDSSFFSNFLAMMDNKLPEEVGQRGSRHD